MKALYYPLIATICLIALFACNQQPETTSAKLSSEANIEHKLNFYQMDSMKAILAIAEWDSIRPIIQSAIAAGGRSDDTTMVPIGFRVPVHDIARIAKIVSDTTQNIYAILAIQRDTNHKAIQPKITLIFRAQDSLGRRVFYDFTEPCPPCAIPQILPIRH